MKFTKHLRKVSVAFIALMIAGMLAACSNSSGGSGASGTASGDSEKEKATKTAYKEITLSVDDVNGTKVIQVHTSATSLYDLVDKSFIDKYVNPYLHVNFWCKNSAGKYEWVCNAPIYFENDGTLKNKTATIDTSKVKGDVRANVKIVYRPENGEWDELKPVGNIEFKMD